LKGEEEVQEIQEIYFSVDIEADGPIPGEYSMLSFGAAAFTPDGKMIGTFSRNLETLPGSSQDPNTMEWWSKQPEAWKACRKDVVPAKEGMFDFVHWVHEMCKKPSHASYHPRPVFVAYPAGFDFTFMYWYMMKFTGKSPFSFSCLDIKSFAMAKLGTNFRKATKRNFPKRWFSKKKHNHVALDDAIEQGELFINILKDAE
jgi:hypothetical protein